MWAAASSQPQLRGSPSGSRRPGFASGVGGTAAASSNPLNKPLGSLPTGSHAGSAAGLRGTPHHSTNQNRARQVPYGVLVDGATPASISCLPLPEGAVVSWRRFYKGKQRAQPQASGAGTSDASQAPAGTRPPPLPLPPAFSISEDCRVRHEPSDDAEAAWSHALAALSRLAAQERRASLDQQRRRRRQQQRFRPSEDGSEGASTPAASDELLSGTLYAVERSCDGHSGTGDQPSACTADPHEFVQHASSSCTGEASLWLYDVGLPTAAASTSTHSNHPSGPTLELMANVDPEPRALRSHGVNPASVVPSVSLHNPLPGNGSMSFIEGDDDLKRQVSASLEALTAAESGTYPLASAYRTPQKESRNASDQPATPEASSLLPEVNTGRAHRMLLHALEDKLADLFVLQRSDEIDHGADQDDEGDRAADLGVGHPSDADEGAGADARAAEEERQNLDDSVQSDLVASPSPTKAPQGAPATARHRQPSASTRIAEPAKVCREGLAARDKAKPSSNGYAGALGPSINPVADLGPRRRRAIRLGDDVVMLPSPACLGRRVQFGFDDSNVTTASDVSDQHDAGSLLLRFKAYTAASDLVIEMHPARRQLRPLRPTDDGAGHTHVVLLPSGRSSTLRQRIKLPFGHESAGISTRADGADAVGRCGLAMAAESLFDALKASGVDRSAVFQPDWVVCAPHATPAAGGDRQAAQSGAVPDDATFLWPAPLCLVGQPSAADVDSGPDGRGPSGQPGRRRAFGPSMPVHEVSRITLEMLQALSAAPMPREPQTDLEFNGIDEDNLPETSETLLPDTALSTASPALVVADEAIPEDAVLDDSSGDDPKPLVKAGAEQTSMEMAADPTTSSQRPRSDHPIRQTSSNSSTIESATGPRPAGTRTPQAYDMALDLPASKGPPHVSGSAGPSPFQWSMFAGAGQSNPGSHVGTSRRQSMEAVAALEGEAQGQRRPAGEGDMFDSFGLVTEDDFSFFDEGAFDLGSGFKEIEASFPPTVDALREVHETASGEEAELASDPTGLIDMDISGLDNLDSGSLEAFLAPPAPPEASAPPPVSAREAPASQVAHPPNDPSPGSLSLLPEAQGTSAAVMRAPLGVDRHEASLPLHPSTLSVERNDGQDATDKHHSAALPVSNEQGLPPPPPPSTAAPAAAAPSTAIDIVRTHHEPAVAHDTPRDGSSMGSVTDIPSLPGFTPCSLTSSSPAFGTNMAKTPRTPFSPNEELHPSVIAVEGASGVHHLYRDGNAALGALSDRPTYQDPPRAPFEYASPPANPQSVHGTAAEFEHVSKAPPLVPIAFLPLAQQREQRRRLNLQRGGQYPPDLSHKYGQLGKFGTWLTSGGGSSSGGRPTTERPRISTHRSVSSSVSAAGTAHAPTSRDQQASAWVDDPMSSSSPSKRIASGPAHLADGSKQMRSREEIRQLRISRFKMPFVSGARRDREGAGQVADRGAFDERAYRAAHQSESNSSSDDDDDDDEEEDDDDDSSSGTDEDATAPQRDAHHLQLLQRVSACNDLHRPGHFGVCSTREGLDRASHGVVVEKVSSWRRLSAGWLTTLATWLVENPSFRSICADGHDRKSREATFSGGLLRPRPAIASSDVLDLLATFASLVVTATGDADGGRQVDDRHLPAGPRLQALLGRNTSSIVPHELGDGDAKESVPATGAAHDAAVAPSIRPLDPARIAVGAQGSVLQMAPTSLPFWDKLNLEAVGGRKDCVVKVLQLPRSHEGQEQVHAWLEQVSRAFEAFGLGSHTAAAEALLTLGDGLDVGLASCLDALPRETWLDTIGSIAGRVQSHLKQGKHVVLYAVQGADSEACRRSGFRGLVRLDHELRSMLQDLVGEASGRFIVRPVSPETISESGCVGLGRVGDGMRAFVFSLYDQLQRVVQRRVPKLLHPEQATLHAALVQYPSFSIVPTGVERGGDRIPRLGRFEQQWLQPSLSMLEDGLLLHIAYDLRPPASAFCDGAAARADGQLPADAGEAYREQGAGAAGLVFLSSIDERAQAHDVRVCKESSADLKAALSAVWRYALQRARRANVAWRIVICRSGGMSVEEARAWSDLAEQGRATAEGLGGTDAHIKDVTIACLDADSAPILVPTATAPPPSTKWSGAAVANATSQQQQQGVLHDVSSLCYAVYPRPRLMVNAGRGERGHRHGEMLALRTSLLVHCSRRGPFGLPMWDGGASDADDEQDDQAAANALPTVQCVHLLQVYRSRSTSNPDRDREQPASSFGAGGVGKDAVDDPGPSLDQRLRDVTQSFHDLEIVTRSRHQIPRPWSELPWHLAVVQMLAAYLA
ncbi:uncharacterized protein PSFLO_05983 [Pseudozyma flocculosa]|uniref:Mediator of RNA polymerase II transcription subunit 13 n=1 Tax=Pseudozyma flocculosa TaxID=84751 RepID=A0A5C3FAN1_9BASI|nr:uncharacterized protein PSFLO_05983 [Pseudozyma flocculosa]